MPSPTELLQQQPTRSPPQSVQSPIIHAPVPASKYFSRTFGFDRYHHQRPMQRLPDSVHTLTRLATLPQYFTPAPHFMQPRPPTIPPGAFTPQPGPGTLPPTNRGERNLADANEAKANRKLDIERRCQQLQPPIPPNILRHMESFKAAIVISRPMNEP